MCFTNSHRIIIKFAGIVPANNLFVGECSAPKHWMCVVNAGINYGDGYPLSTVSFADIQSVTKWYRLSK